MRTLSVSFSFLLLVLSGCVQPPDVDPCLIDMNAKLAYCVPVDKHKKPYDLPIEKLHKYTAYSPEDEAALLRWFLNHQK